MVDVISCEKDEMLTNAQIAGKTIDVSEAGMKLAMYVGVPERARIALHLNAPFRQFNLEGEVRWLRENGEAWVGVLLDEDSTDYESCRAVTTVVNPVISTGAALSGFEHCLQCLEAIG